MDLIEKKVSGEDIFDGIVLHVRKDTVELPNGNTSTREYIKHNPGKTKKYILQFSAFNFGFLILLTVFMSVWNVRF